MKRVVVIGPGAIGCLFAGMLSRAAEVWLLDHDPARAARIVSQDGIFCEGLEKWNAKVPVTAETRDIGVADLVILCTKSFHTGEALMRARIVIGDHTAVLSIQNGVGNAALIEKIVGRDRAFAGVTSHAVILKEEGRIEHVGSGQTVIGALAGKTSGDLGRIKKLLSAAGLRVKISEDIRGLLWSKLIINVGINALTALTRLPNGQLLDYEGTEILLTQAVEEAVRVARRKRIVLLYKDPVGAVIKACKDSRFNHSSMLQDVLKKKRTEIDHINGVIVHEAKALKILVPVNTALCHLIKTIEQSYALRAE